MHTIKSLGYGIWTQLLKESPDRLSEQFGAAVAKLMCCLIDGEKNVLRD